MDPELKFQEIAKLTEGFSGSDLKNLCTAAAYAPIRELLEEEQKKAEEGIPIEDTKTPNLRPLALKDFITARKEVNSSLSEDNILLEDLRKWNELYGDGGAKKRTHLPYFL